MTPDPKKSDTNDKKIEDMNTYLEGKEEIIVRSDDDERYNNYIYPGAQIYAYE